MGEQGGHWASAHPGKKIRAWPTLEILAMVWKLPGNSLLVCQWRYSSEQLNYLSILYVSTSVLRWAGWATVMYGRVDKLKTRMGKRKKIFSTSRGVLWNKYLPTLSTLAWNPAGTPDYSNSRVGRFEGPGRVWDEVRQQGPGAEPWWGSGAKPADADDKREWMPITAKQWTAQRLVWKYCYG